MESEIIEKYKKRFSDLEDVIKQSNYSNARNISNNIINVSVFLEVPELIFIGEFYENLFDNLAKIDTLFNFNQEIKNELNDKIVSSINLIKDNIPIDNNDIKANLFDVMVKLRSDVTKVQIKYVSTEQKKKEIPGLNELVGLAL